MGYDYIGELSKSLDLEIREILNRDATARIKERLKVALEVEFGINISDIELELMAYSSLEREIIDKIKININQKRGVTNGGSMDN